MYRGDDILKIYDQDLNNIGRATREEVHTQGLLHQVAHVWMFQPKEDDTYIMIQKRSLDRELYPGKYDLIQTTHFDPDESYEEAIVDSLEYYRGLKKSKEDIIHVGSTHQQIDAGDYHDNALVHSQGAFHHAGHRRNRQSPFRRLPPAHPRQAEHHQTLLTG